MDIAGFQAITGASEANARKFLGQANNNLELALSQYFEAGIEPETVPPPVTHDPVADGPSPAEAAKARVDAVLGADYLAALVTKDRTAVVPLLGVDARVTIHDLAAAVTLTHRFVNNGDAGVEATFMFRHDEAAVHSLVAEIGGKRVVGTIREKDAAFEEYSDAISARDTGILVEQGANEAALQLSIGNLPPGDEAVITLSFDVELALDGNSLKFVLPATAAEIEPVAESTGDAAGIAGVTLTVDVATSFPLGELVCPSHEAAVTMGDDGHTGSLTIADGAAAGRSEFTLVITADDVRAPRVTVAPGVTEGEHALMVSFFPELEEGDEDEMTEMIFLVDRSGSMAGGRMRQARNALQLFLRSIPLGTRFNIVGFGSTYEKLFTASRPYNNKTLRAANAAVEAMDANLVGTNILPPLLDIFNSPTDDRFPRQIFVLTDGEVDNTAEVLDAVRDGAFGSRVFTFGIGGDASRALVRGMAVNGNGAAEFVRSGERLEPPVLRQVKRALQPALKSVSIEWGDAINTEALKQSPSVLPPVFDGDKFVLYGLTSDLDGGAAGSVTLSGELHGEEVSFQVPYDANAAVAAPSVARLAARSMIRELERLGRVAGGSDNAHKADIVDIALRYSLLSSYTSFVGVVEQEVATEGNMEVVTVDPVEAYRQGKGGAIGDGDYVNDVKLPANANDLLEGIAFGGAGMGGVRQQQQQRQRKLGKRLERRRGGGRANWGGPGAARAQASPAMAPHNAMFGGMGGGGGGGGWGAPTAAAPAPAPRGMRSSRLDAPRGMALSRSSAVAAPADFNEYAQEGAVAYELYADDDEDAREAVFDGFSFNDSPTMPTGVTLLADESSASRSDGDGDGDDDDYNEDADLRGSVNDGLVALGAAQRVLDPLVALQQAAGNWLLTGTLCALLETDGEAVEAGGVMPSNAVWATALAIAFIEGRLGEFRDEWEVLVGKGRKWLRRTFGGDVDALLAAAGGKLGL